MINNATSSKWYSRVESGSLSSVAVYSVCLGCGLSPFSREQWNCRSVWDAHQGKGEALVNYELHPLMDALNGL